jgi:hypothetical protein
MHALRRCTGKGRQGLRPAKQHLQLSCQANYPERLNAIVKQEATKRQSKAMCGLAPSHTCVAQRC